MQALQTVNKISFKNILFLTDFSEASNTAVAYATGMARHYNAQLYAGHSCDPVILTETAGTNILQEVEDNSRTRLETLARETGPKTVPLFARGSVANAVPGWINEHGIDLIIMGTNGRRGLQHLLLGSTAEAIVRSATCPVLTVGPHVTTRPYHDFKRREHSVPHRPGKACGVWRTVCAVSSAGKLRRPHVYARGHAG